MPDNTNVNNNAAVVVVGRTAPVPPGQQKSDKSIPVVIASDQETIPVAEQNKVQSEVALSLLGIPRSEVALGIFADVNTYDVNPTEWTAEPEQYGTYTSAAGSSYENIVGVQGHGLSHIPLESGALIEAPADKTAVLTSKRFFRYQPGRVSAATFGVKTTTIDDAGAKSNNVTSGGSNSANGSAIPNTLVANPTVRKYGIFDKYDGYYWETRNNAKGDNFCVVRRTQSLQYYNPLPFDDQAGAYQSQDYGRTNPTDPLGRRGSESLGAPSVGWNNTDNIPDVDLTPSGYVQTKPFGDLLVLRDNLLMSHAGVYDASLLQPEWKAPIFAVVGSNKLQFEAKVGVAVSISNAVYDETTGLMVVTTYEPHGFHDGKYLTLSGIGMTCRYSYANGDGTGALDNNKVKIYPINNREYNIVELNSSTSFTINVGVSTVKTYYHQPDVANGKPNGWAVGLSTGQHVSYSKGSNTNSITGLVDTQIFRIKTLGINTTSGITDVDLYTYKQNSTTGEVDLTVSADALSGREPEYLVTPVPFIQPLNGKQVYQHDGYPNDSLTKNTAYIVNEYGKKAVHTGISSVTNQGTGMFPYLYKDPATNEEEGYVDTTLDPTIDQSNTKLKAQIDNVNITYRKWVNQNVAKDYWNVYEYRIPRSRFSGDRLDGMTDDLLYSDAVGINRPGDNVIDDITALKKDDTSIWNLEFDKVTMYKIEFSWYGAVGALFLAYVPVSNGEARWVRVHHLRASNQLKVASLGNATLPITYMVYGGGNQDRFGYLNSKRLATSDYTSASQHIVKYGASYYIDGGDRGTVKLFSYATPNAVQVYGSTRSQSTSGSTADIITVSNKATSATDTPKDGYYLEVGGNLDETTSSIVGFCTGSYYVGAQVITGNPLDQNVKINYVDFVNQRLYLNIPLQSTTIPGSTIDVIPDRPTPLIGLKCRDFITSSLGQKVRNRTQVYPTRMSTGSNGQVKIDFLKTPTFQTDAVVTNAGRIMHPQNADGTTGSLSDSAPSISASINIGKRGKPTKLVDANGDSSIPEVIYAGHHTFVSGTSAVEFYNASGGGTATTMTIVAATYAGTEGSDGSSVDGNGVYTFNGGKLRLEYTSGTTFTTSNTLKILEEKLGFTCTLDNNTATKYYPRATDPVHDKILTIIDSGTNGSNKWVEVRVGKAKAEYIRDPGTGVYGWFRGYYKNAEPKTPISVLGYLENRQMKRQQDINADGYYFSALESTSDDIILASPTDPDVIGKPFLREDNITPRGAGEQFSDNSFTLADLSSVKIAPETRSPIPGSAVVVSSLYAPASGENYDLSPYFDYNKEYLSFPLTDRVESLYLCASSQGADSSVAATISASLTWEEQ